MEIVIRDEVTGVLDAIGAKRKNKQIAEAIGLAVVGLTIRAFNDPSVRAAPWDSLRPETLREKLRIGASSAILKRRTILFRSWRVVEATSSYVRVGSDRFYALFQQLGTRNGVPARPMLPLLGSLGGERFTALAVRRMIEAGQAVLSALIARGK